MTIYLSFGLIIDSEIDLPELLPGKGEPDVAIRQGSLGLTAEEPTYIKCLRADSNEALLYWGSVGQALIRGGREIVIDPLPSTPDGAVRLFLLGAVLGVLLHQRGLTVLHASAVAIDGQAVAFIGSKGAGKSSLAAALCARSHAFLSDDQLAIRYTPDGQPLALAGFPQLKFWPDTAELLGYDTLSLERIRPEVEKRSHTPEFNQDRLEYPLKAIYLLGKGDTFEQINLPTTATFFYLLRNLYVSRFGAPFHQAGLKPNPFEQVARLTRAVPVYGLKRIARLEDLPDTASWIEQAVLAC